MDYILNNDHAVLIDGETIISNEQLIEAINFCNHAIRTLDEQTKQFDINIFEVLGMRNLSGMVGEYFAKSVERFSGDPRKFCVIDIPRQYEKRQPGQEWK